MNRARAAAIILVVAFAADILYGRFFAPSATPHPLRIPFSQFPMDLLGPGWKGADIPLKPETERIAAVSDYIQRYYTDGKQKIWFYVGYVPGWNPQGIHHPGICFPLFGLKLEDEGMVEVPCPEGAVPLRFKESRWRNADGGTTYTLTTFYFRGMFEPAEFQLWADRKLGIPYYAIITVSGTVQGSIDETRAIYHRLLRAAMPQLLKHFPQ